MNYLITPFNRILSKLYRHVISLFQNNPKRKATYKAHKHHKDRSKTGSLESYNNSAKQEISLLMNNKRRPKHSFVLHFLSNFPAKEIQNRWRKIRMYLKKAEIIAYRSMEITRDGTGKPINRIHFHFLVDSDLSENELRLILRDCCLCSGLTENEFRIDYKPVVNFLGIACYITKLHRPEKTILFAKYTGLRKFETIGPWYVDESGNPIRRKQAWENIIEVQKAKAESEGSGSNVSEPQLSISTPFESVTQSATNERNSQMTNTEMQHYDLNWIEYNLSTQSYYLKPDDDYRSLQVEDGQLFVSWSEVQTAIETLRDEAFDRPVKHIIVDDDNCKFLRSEKNVTQAMYDEWVAEGKNVFDNVDIRKFVHLPEYVDFEDAIFVLFFENGDEDTEEKIFAWAVFMPSE